MVGTGGRDFNAVELGWVLMVTAPGLGTVRYTKPRIIFFCWIVRCYGFPFGLLCLVSPFYLGSVGARVSMVIHAWFISAGGCTGPLWSGSRDDWSNLRQVRVGSEASGGRQGWLSGSGLESEVC